MESSALIRIMILILSIGTPFAANIFRLGQIHPSGKDEISTCGNIRDVIRRNSARFRKILVRNANTDIAFVTDDSRRMTARAKSKLDVLASRVKTRWPGRKLKVLKAWTDRVVPGTVSLHYEGRAVQLIVDDNDKGKLGELAGLAVQAGFDWIQYTRNNYVHTSVIRDVCQTSIDLAFILDSSGSVGSYDFEQIKKFVKNVIDFFNIGRTGTHVGVVTYSSWPVVEFNLQGHYSKTSLKNAVSQIHYRAGWTYTGDALEMTRTDIFNVAHGMRPDKGIPKIAVLLTDGYSNGWGVTSAANALKSQGVSIFCIGIGNYNKRELNDIATDPDSSHVFTLSNFNDLSSWVDKLSAVSCDEGAVVSACDNTASSVEGGSFLYFKTKFVSVTGGISVEVKDIQGISHLYASLTTTNPGPMDPNSFKNELNTSPRSLRLSFSSSRSSTFVYVAVQGQQNTNKFQLSMWDTLFARDNYTANPLEEQNTKQHVITVASSVTAYRLRYSIIDGDNEGKFQINSQSGQITATKLDREVKATFRLTVLARDEDNACHKGRTVVNVNVRDINDNAPTFERNPYQANVKENARIGTLITTVKATDKDTSDTLSYRIVNSFSAFSIDNNGRIETTRELDFEQKQSYRLEIRASDTKHEAITFVDIRVISVNERPVFKSVCAKNNLCSFRVSENQPANTVVGTLVANDPDTGDKLSYKLKMLDSQDTVFAIDSSGRITLTKSLDREVKPSYSVLVTVSDDGSPLLAIQTRISIVVTDVNDNSPRFPFSSYKAVVYENAAKGSTVIQVIADDADVGINSKLTYSLRSGDTRFFTIDPNNGIIRTSQPLDRETKSTYQLSVRVEDGGSPRRDGQTSITINILDVNDNTPRFTRNQYSASVHEDAAVRFSITTVRATDADTGINADLRYYIISGNYGNTFSLNTKSGVVNLAGALDYERRTSYRLVIGVSDRGLPSLSSSSNLLITVSDVNDNSPVFVSSVYRTTVKEKSSKGTSVVKVLATDRDTGSNAAVQYFIIRGNDNTFAIDPNSGLVTINNPPNFKTKSQYDLTIEARDQGQTIRSATTQAIVTIEDINDNKPIFDQKRYDEKVPEDVAVGTIVITVKAKDEDTGPRGRVVYCILSGNVGNKFTIDGRTGSIKVSSSLDREVTDVFTLTIEARDGGTPSLSSTSQVVINVTDINDHTPTFNGPYTFHVSEDKPKGSLVGQVLAVDRDSGENGRVTYSASIGPFTIDPDTGLIRLAKSIDHETKASYSLTVTATDHGTPPKHISTVVKVIVDDVNDNPPDFPQDMYNCSVAENMAKGAAVCYVTAVDLDSGANGQLRYSMSGGNGKFSINSHTGEITTTSPLDRESTANYRLKVTVRDGQTSRSSLSFSDSVDVYVSVQDENDNSPLFKQASYQFIVKENALVGASVGSVIAIDADTGPNGRLTYSILNANAEFKFRIDAQSGVMYVQKLLDREQTAQYSLMVQAKDSGSPVPQATSVIVKVTIEDVNDNPPVFEYDSFHGRIREDASIGSTVLQVKAVDKDQGPNAQLTFSLSGKGSENFTIDSTGFVKSSTNLDYETTSSYLLTVTAVDSGSPSLKDTAKVNITVINVNDNVPTFDSTAQITSIPEDVAIGTRVVKLNATDSDGNILTFRIEGGNVGKSFSIGLSSGVITVAKRLDRERIANYTLVVKAIDTGGQFVSNNATIRVLDVNDNKPIFEQSSYKASLLENKPTGTSVAKVHATDLDAGKNAEITYQLTSGDKTKFKIDPTSGLITTLTTLDREQQQTYQLYVTAKDHGTPSQSSVVLVTVTVRDVNDNKPKFSQSSYSVSLVENTARDAVVLRLRAVDPDEGSNGRLLYTMASGNVNNTFKVNSITGELSVLGPVDRETKTFYNLTVKASDSGNPSLSSMATVSITISDENDNAPVFTNQNASFTVMENAARGTFVGVVMATDADAGSNSKVVYSITKGATSVFAINPTSGRITVNGGTDRETIAAYQLTIRASDRGSPVMFNDKQFRINVDDVNDNAPTFDKSVYQVNIREDSPRLSSVVIVKATDADRGTNAAVRYQIASGNTHGLFSIDGVTGLIRTTGSLDYEQQTKYTFEILATDSKKSTKANVIIDVIDVNDNSPVFNKTEYFASVQENKLTQVLRVSASDKDPFGGLVYSLDSRYQSSKRFNIDPTSGVISTAKALDREIKDRYVIQVLVADGGTPARTDTANVTINVTDVNDNRPTFNESTYSVSILEDVAVNTFVTKLYASDGDLGTNAQVSYSIVPTSFFSIEPATGIVRNTKTLDRETIPSYTLTCTATDHGNPKLTSERVTIQVTILDTNDNSPSFEQQLYYSNVSENEAVGSLVAEVLAVDRDLGDAGTVVYRITSGNDNGMFTVGNNTGIISLRSTPDREVQDNYTLTIQASDLGTPPRSSATKVYINILDVNDNTPKFKNMPLRGSVKENKPAGTSVLQLTATDADSGSNAEIHFKFLTDEYKNIFSLNSETGEIETRKSLDRERQERYLLKVSVRDMGNPRLTSTADVIIDVIDEDDNCPTFQYTEYNVTISEDIEQGEEIAQVLATDIDQENVTYYIKSGNPSGAFTIDRKTGKIKVANREGVDRESYETFQLVVRAGTENCGVNETDGGNTAEGGIDILSSAIATVNIIITDVNDNPPSFQKSAYEYDFNDITKTDLFTITATDDDLNEGGIVKYKMAGQTEIGGNHVANVVAYDQGSPSLESKVTVTVRVKSGLSCEAMVFKVTSNGLISVKTLCHFEEKPEDKTVLSGTPHKLKCLAKGNTIPQYRWMLDGRILTTYSSSGSYDIKRLSQEDEGSYACLASSEAGVIQSPAATLTVHEGPVVTFHPENTSAALESTATLECRAKGDPEPRYYWHKNGAPIPASDGIEPDRPTLVLRNAIIQDQAWYYCLVTNSAGKTTSNSAYLKIFNSNSLVSLEISINKPNLAKRCHIFDLKTFKETLNKVFEAQATITNMTVAEENMCESDPCFNNPCKNGGVCKAVRGTNKYSCRCKPGWAGKDCNIDIDECVRTPCLNATCSNTKGNYQCACTSHATGKNCYLRRSACAESPCNSTDICFLSEMHSVGYKCLRKENIIEMKYSKNIDGDDKARFDLEKKMQEIIISAPDNNNKNNINVNVKRRRRSTNDNADYGTCVVRIHSIKGDVISFVLLCPKELNPSQDVVRNYVCELMLGEKITEACGSGSAMMTAVPPITYPPMNPMRVKIILFGRDKSNRDIQSEQIIGWLKSDTFKKQMAGQGVEFLAAKQVRPKALKSKPARSNTGLVVGLSVFGSIAIAVAGLILFLYYRRRAMKNKHVNLEDRAILRRDSRHQNVQRNVSTKDITRSEKKYINQAFTDSMYEDDDEGAFMVEVNLSSPKRKVTPLNKLYKEMWYYDKTTPIEAEELLDSKVQPGTFLVRKGNNPEEYVLTVKCPNGGPSHRHLLLKYTNKHKFEVQFGSMPLSLEFDTVGEVIEHFQVTPIEFGPNVPDVVLTNGWCKTHV